MRAWLIDISGWNITQVVKNDPSTWLHPDYKTIVENGCSAVVIKGSMGGGISTTAAIQAKICRDAGFPYIGIYHWADPIHKNPNQQLGHLERIIEIVKPDFIAIDNEQWWASWNAYYQFSRGEISYQAVPKLSSQHISQFGYELTRKARERFGLWTLNYTADWFIASHAPQMRQWINEFDLWFAYYPVRYGQFKDWQDFYSFVNVRQPVLVLPKGAQSWAIWQFADKYKLPNFVNNIDLNIFNGTPEELKAKINREPYQKLPEQDEEPYYELYKCKAVWGMIVRDEPEGKDLGRRIRFNEEFRVYEKVVTPKHTWGKLHPNVNEWVALTWSERIK